MVIMPLLALIRIGPAQTRCSSNNRLVRFHLETLTKVRLNIYPARRRRRSASRS